MLADSIVDDFVHSVLKFGVASTAVLVARATTTAALKGDTSETAMAHATVVAMIAVISYESGVVSEITRAQVTALVIVFGLYYESGLVSAIAVAHAAVAMTTIVFYYETGVVSVWNGQRHLYLSRAIQASKEFLDRHRLLAVCVLGLAGGVIQVAT